MERTCELIKQAKEGNKEAQSILVEENSGLIWSVVKRFQGRGYDKEDLFQIGSIGLLKCIENFDLERNVKFSTYAVPLIMGEIKRFLRDDGIVKVSRSLKEASYKIKREKEHYQKLYNKRNCGHLRYGRVRYPYGNGIWSGGVFSTPGHLSE